MTPTQTTTYAPRLASDAQFAFIKRLISERALTDYLQARVDVARTLATTGHLSSTNASALITDLKVAPYKPTETSHAEAAEGYYVNASGDAYRVQMNKAGTHTYAMVWTGTAWIYSRGTGRTLAGLTPMTAEDAARIGLASGRCINCCRQLGGETLTAKVSVLVGYGETCAANNDWAYPKGAKAQRAYVAASTNKASAERN